MPLPLAGGGRGWAALQSKLYRLKYPVHVLKYFIVPEANYAITFSFKISGADQVFLALAVLAAIHFDDQLTFAAQKIADVGSDRHLAREFDTIQLAPVQKSPASG